MEEAGGGTLATPAGCSYLWRVTRAEGATMVALAAFIVGVLALIWSVVITSIGLALLFALLIPLLILSIFFRIGFAMMRLGAIFLLLCVVAVWLI